MVLEYHSNWYLKYTFRKTKIASGDLTGHEKKNLEYGKYLPFDLCFSVGPKSSTPETTIDIIRKLCHNLLYLGRDLAFFVSENWIGLPALQTNMEAVGIKVSFYTFR